MIPPDGISCKDFKRSVLEPLEETELKARGAHQRQAVRDRRSDEASRRGFEISGMEDVEDNG